MEDRLKEIKAMYDRFGTGLDDIDSLWLIKEVERLRAERTSAVNEATRLHNRITHIHSALAKEMSWAALGPDDLGTLLTAVINQRRGALTELAEIHDILAAALGYQKAPTLEEDPNCPCPGDYVTGDHTAASLAIEAARELKRMTGHNNALERNLRQADQRATEHRRVRNNYEAAITTSVDQIVELQRELAAWANTKKAELRREIAVLRFKCSCPYNNDMDYLARDSACPTHGDEAAEAKLAAEKAINTLKYVRKYFMGSEHGHEV